MEIARDPVCGMYVAQGTLQFAYGERSFLFCGFPCLDRFREEPEAFLRLEEARRASAELPTTDLIASRRRRP
jgi:YHS domain-containing protein